MSAITLQASATGAGIITLAAPATANNYTLTLPAETGTVLTTASTLSNVASVGMKNRVINGAMVIDQRNAGASVTPANGIFTLDRWGSFQSVAGKFSVQQNAGSVTPPPGFSNYLGLTSLSAYSIGTSDYYLQQQRIEGFNFADCGWGTANAATITLSFWVRSSLTGTFGGSLVNSADNRSYPFTYTINSANTWEFKTIVIPGDTSGTWVGATNGVGVKINFSAGVGSTLSSPAGAWATGNYLSSTGATSVVGTSGATFYITGVQLEKGSTATSFEFRHYGTELQLCQRYCQVFKGSDTGNANTYARIGYGPAQGSGTGIAQIKLLVTLRAVPSVTASGSFVLYDGVIIPTVSAPTLDVASTPYSVLVAYGGATGLTATRAYELIINGNSPTTYLWLTAEL